jgi:protein involved in polysaccharide export with SLBB domain
MRFPKESFVCKRLLLLLLFTTFFSCLSSLNSYAQLPDEGQDLPIDPNALKNLSSQDLQNLLRDNNQSVIKAGEDLHKKQDESDNTKTNAVIVDSTKKDNIKQQLYSPDAVYGADLFQNKQIIELSELSTPPPDYPIGVGDHIIVSLWGGADFEENYEVGRDGSIFPQGLGKITVQGLTFENARKIVTDRFRKVIPPSTNISVTLGQPRSIVVQVSGEVMNPGPQVVSAFTNAINVVALAGGMTKYGNLRNILISRNGQIIDSIDIYKYLLTGDFGKHLYLENNDFVIVPFYDKKVQASGQFRRPMIYQLKQGEGLLDLFKYAGGFTPEAYQSAGEIIRNTDEKQVIKTIDFNSIGKKVDGVIQDETLMNGDVVVVNPINQGLTNKVIVKGEVAYPNVYEIKKGDRLFDVINRAGGITPNSYIERAYIYRGAGDSTNIKADKIVVSLADLNKNLNSENNIRVYPNDVIEVFNKNQFSDRQYVTIEGEVRKPGKFQRYGGMNLKDLLYFANGLKPSAEFGKIVVTSVVDIDSSQQGLRPTKTVIHTYSINANLALDSVTENVKLMPYDEVIVRKNPTFHLQQNVKINGMVKYPGTYPILNDGERLSSFIERSGGLIENANPDGAMLYRVKDTVANLVSRVALNQTKYIRDKDGNVIDSILFDPTESVSIDLKKALENKDSKYDMVLRQGDIIYIPELNPIVTITGAVQSQVKIFFDHEHGKIGYYIDKAGGLGIRPWRKRIYVTYANGRSRRTHNFGFFHFYPRVQPGSVIVVPQRPEGKNAGNFFLQSLVTSIPILMAFAITKL